MKKIYLTTLLLLLFCGLFAQTPTFWNYNVTGSGNAFPFGTTTSRKVQWRILANSMGAVTAGNNITAVYFMTGNASSNTYPLINIRLKQGPTQFAGGGNYEVGMTLVYSGTNITKTGTTGGWIQFILQTPFLYDPTQALFVEVEHNATTGTGPTVYQTSPVGPGNGRQYGNFPNATYTGADATVVHFGIDVLPATPCTVAPAPSLVTPANFTTCPFLTNPSLSLATTYSFGGIQYQWQMSTVSNVGPFTPVPGATLTTYATPTLGVNTWYTCVATCTNPGGGSTTLTPSQFLMGNSVVNTVPYFEDFEGILINNRLPNCSWYAQNLGTSANSYVSANTGNRIARSGSKFGSFSLPSTNNQVYSNGISLVAGVTYSAAIWYSTEYFGYSNWTDLSLLVGNTQTSVGQQTIASVGPAISGAYKLLSGVFTVPTSGDYYIGIRATGIAGSAPYLNYDDLSVTIPCDGLGASNSPTVVASGPTGPICQGDILSFFASGADSYLWNNGDAVPTTTMVASTSTVVSVVGTNSLTGCTASTSILLSVKPSPFVFANTNKPVVCTGEPALLTGNGAVTYAWNNGVAAQINTVTPTASTSYTVIGSAANGCSGTATIGITVIPKPTVSLNLDRQTVCIGDAAILNAVGATSYSWTSSSSNLVYQGAILTVPLQTTTNFTVNGTGTNGCVGTAVIAQNVTECTGVTIVTEAPQNISVYPNPSKDMFSFKMQSGIMHKVVITDLSGRIISESTPKQAEFTLDLSAYAAGVYYANVMDENSTKVIRLVKE